jgi:hypothetical protein
LNPAARSRSEFGWHRFDAAWSEHPEEHQITREKFRRFLRVEACDTLFGDRHSKGVPLDAKNSAGETPLALADHQECYREAIDRQEQKVILRN